MSQTGNKELENLSR